MPYADSKIDEPTLRRLLDVGRGLVSELDLETLLQRILDTARELTGARYAALGILNDRRDALARFLTVGIDRERHREIGDLPRGRGVLGVIFAAAAGIAYVVWALAEEDEDGGRRRNAIPGLGPRS